MRGPLERMTSPLNCGRTGTAWELTRLGIPKTPLSATMKDRVQGTNGSLQKGGGYLNFHINGPSIGPKFFPLVPFSPVVGQWYHLAVVRKGNVYTIYINGLPGGTEVNTDSIPNPDAPLTIGQAESLGFMNGRLDEVTIYNRALTQTELQSIVAADSAGKCKSLLISTRSLPPAQVSVAYSQVLTAQFNSGNLNWSLVGGSLPPGLSITPSGIISGTPTQVGAFPMTISVTDGTTNVQRAFNLEVGLAPPPPMIRAKKSGTIPIPGRIVDYFVVIENAGPTRQELIEVTEILNPQHFELLSISPPGVASVDVHRRASSIQWIIPELQAGATVLLSYKARVKPTVLIGTTISGGPLLFTLTLGTSSFPLPPIFKSFMQCSYDLLINGPAACTYDLAKCSMQTCISVST